MPQPKHRIEFPPSDPTLTKRYSRTTLKRYSGNRLLLFLRRLLDAQPKTFDAPSVYHDYMERWKE